MILQKHTHTYIYISTHHERERKKKKREKCVHNAIETISNLITTNLTE